MGSRYTRIFKNFNNQPYIDQATHPQSSSSFWRNLLRGIPHEGRNPSFEPKSKFLWNHRDSKFLRNSQKILRFQVLHFTDFKIRKQGHGISKFLFDEIEVSPNQNIQQDSVCYMRLTASLMCLQRIACTTSK